MKNLSLRAKLLLLSAFMSIISLTVGLTAYWYTYKITSAFTEVVKDDVPSIRQISRMLLSYRAARIEILHLIVPGRSPELNEESFKSINAAWVDFEKDQNAYASGELSPEEKVIYAELKEVIDVTKSDFKHALVLFKKNTSEDSAERKEMTRFITTDLDRHGRDFGAAAQKLVEYNSQEVETDSNRAYSEAKNGNLITLSATFIGCIFGLLSSFLFSKELSQQISKIINSISESSERVSTTSTEIAASSQQLSQSATQQAAALEETAASLEQISAMVAKASDNAEATARSSAESQQKAEEGRSAADQMMNSMDEISQSNEAIMIQVNSSNTRMSEIVNVIQEIGNKTKVINEIVFQTKLLSFNASVEAARAGEHGKGFAVVAEEVGNLAQMSGNAAKEISNMLEGSISKVEQMVSETKTKVESLIENGKQKVSSGVEIARQCSEVLNEIVNNVSQVTRLSQEISEAGKEQAQGIAEINKAMNQLDMVTQQNSSASEEAASTAEQLSAQANSLKIAIEELVKTVRGDASSAHQDAEEKLAHKTPESKPSKASKLMAKPQQSKKKPEVKPFSGEGSVPSRGEDGFKDI